MITRRTLAALLGATALAACAGQTPTQIAQAAVGDAALIASGLSNFVIAAPGIQPATAAKISAAAADANKLAASLSASMTATQAQPIVQQIAADVTAVAQAAAGLVPPGSQAAQILADVQLVMPLLQVAVGLAVPAAATVAAAPDAARARLQALPKTG